MGICSWGSRTYNVLLRICQLIATKVRTSCISWGPGQKYVVRGRWMGRRVEGKNAGSASQVDVNALSQFYQSGLPPLPPTHPNSQPTPSVAACESLFTSFTSSRTDHFPFVALIHLGFLRHLQILLNKAVVLNTDFFSQRIQFCKFFLLQLLLRIREP